MVSPCLGAELVGDVVHVDFWVGSASTAVWFWGRAGWEGDGGDHERDYVGRAVVCGEDDSVEGGHVGAGPCAKRIRRVNCARKGRQSEKRIRKVGAVAYRV